MTGVDLKGAERRIFDALREADGLASHDMLIRALVYPCEPLDTDAGTLKTYIYRLRKHGIRIVSIRGVGYMLAEHAHCPTCGQVLPEKR